MITTIDFLRQLELNNNREWFQDNREMYDKSHAEMLSFAEQLISGMNQHDHIENTSGRSSLYRIYRDVRFGNDKTPYKTNWAGRLRRATAELRGGYYYQIGVRESFVMGGFFSPNPKDLLHIRNQLSLDSVPLREVIESKAFKDNFKELIGLRLKTAPRGFEKDHPDLDLLQYKQYLVRHDFTRKEVQSDHFSEIMVETFSQMRPFFNCMSEWLTTDLNVQSLL